MLSLLLPSLLQLFPSFTATRSLFCLIFQVCFRPLCKNFLPFFHIRRNIFLISFLIVDDVFYNEETVLAEDISKTKSEWISQKAPHAQLGELLPLAVVSALQDTYHHRQDFDNTGLSTVGRNDWGNFLCI